MKHTLVLILISSYFFNFVFADSKIESLVIVVPVYREFKTQNIGRLIQSIARQQIQNPDKFNIDLVFIVNHTIDTDQSIKDENRQTVDYLNSLKEKSLPLLNSNQTILKQAYKDLMNSKLDINFHILDYTQPGFDKRNIGKVRNIANNYAFKYLDKQNRLQNSLFHQMDADTVVPSNYLEYLEYLLQVFANPSIKYALLSLQLTHEANSSPRVYQRIVVDSTNFYLWEFEAALKKIHPISGTPRIVTRGQTLLEVNGVPEIVEAEDRELVSKLSKSFPKQGLFLHSLSVLTSFRARNDGYDAKYNLQNLHNPIELSHCAKSKMVELEKIEKEIKNKYPQHHLYKEMLYIELINSHQNSTLNRLNQLRQVIVHVQNYNTLMPITVNFDLFFTANG
jgi:hypothetical protein